MPLDNIATFNRPLGNHHISGRVAVKYHHFCYLHSKSSAYDWCNLSTFEELLRVPLCSYFSNLLLDKSKNKTYSNQYPKSCFH